MNTLSLCNNCGIYPQAAGQQNPSRRGYCEECIDSFHQTNGKAGKCYTCNTFDRLYFQTALGADDSYECAICIQRLFEDTNV